jgi:hypothetical protein
VLGKLVAATKLVPKQRVMHPVIRLVWLALLIGGDSPRMLPCSGLVVSDGGSWTNSCLANTDIDNGETYGWTQDLAKTRTKF